MFLVILVTGLLTLVVESVTGVRLVLLARKSRAVPEIALGACFTFSAAMIASRLMLKLAFPGAPELLFTLVRGFFFIGANVALWVGIWKLFYPDHRGVRALVLTIAALQSATFIGELAGLNAILYDGVWPSLLELVNMCLFNSAFVWAGFEVGRYSRALARRVEVGLATPFMVHRFRTWASACVVWVIFHGFLVASIYGWITEATARTLMTPIAFTGSAMVYFTFFPPLLWLRRLNADSPAQGIRCRANR